MTRLGAVLFLVVGAIAGLFFYLQWASEPPKEKELIENFYAHRAAFERLREMLQADEQVVRVAEWGVENKIIYSTHSARRGFFSRPLP